jgi:membrane fusion protein, multidrug efflux system
LEIEEMEIQQLGSQPRIAFEWKATMRQLLYAIILVCICSPSVYAQQGQAATAVSVGTVAAVRKPIAETRDFVGRVEAINRVDVRARVTGYLEEVLFKEGDLVREGDPLYRIEKGLFQAAVEQAEGALSRSTASKDLTQIQLQRAEELLSKASGTAVARDQAKAADDQAKGAMMQDEASLQTARINLGYTDIVSPISGKVGRTKVTKGNVVGPESGVLTTIVSQDPMYVTFPISQREFLRLEAAGREVSVENVRSVKVSLRFSDGSTYTKTGEINFIDVTVDRTTDTVTVRATFPNPSGALIDGQLVRVGLESGAPKEKILIPQAALIADQGGTYVFVVDDSKATIKRVTASGESGADVVVDQGLVGGEQVIVEGLQSLRAGTPVLASPLPQALRN